MKRLTRKNNSYYDTDGLLLYECVNKLGELEDIEEELGIDLITLFKVLKNGIYCKGISIFDTTGIFFEYEPLLDIENKCLTHIMKLKNQNCVWFKDYGKTWALTKEELEK